MNTVERRVRALINPWSTGLTRWWCYSGARMALTGHRWRADGRRRRDVARPAPADAPADGMPHVVRIEPLTQADVAPAVDLAARVLRVKPGDRGEQFASDITDDLRQMFVAKVNGQVVGYGRVIELAADDAGPGTPAGCYLSGVLVDPAWRGRGIATALTRARLRWAFAHTDTVFYIAGADNTASLHLHAALGFKEIKRSESDRSAAGVDVLSQLVRSTATLWAGPTESQPHLAARGTIVRIGSSWANDVDRSPPGRRCTVVNCNPVLVHNLPSFGTVCTCRAPALRDVR